MGQLTKILGIPIVTFEQQKELGLCGIVFNPLDDSMVFLETPTEIRVSNTLWHIGWSLNTHLENHPNWSGFVQNNKHEDVSEKSIVYLLPIIDLNPSNKTCVYSTLQYVP